MGDVALDDRVLERQRHQFDVIAVTQDLLAELRNGIEGSGQVDLLEDARPGDGHAGRRPAAELGKPRAGEGGRAFVPDADVGDIPLLHLPAHCVSHAQDGKTDHAENMRDTPVDHCLNHDIADRARNADDFLNLYINAVLTLLNRESGDRGVGAVGILAGERIEAPAMPGAYELAVLDGALPQRTAQMRDRPNAGNVRSQPRICRQHVPGRVPSCPPSRESPGRPRYYRRRRSYTIFL